METLFTNILDTRTKQKRITATIIILSFVISSVLLVACSSDNTKLLSPVEVVMQNLTARKNNDLEALDATLVEGYKFSEEGDRKLGVIQLEIIEVKEETNPRYMEETLEGEAAKNNGWTKDNLAFVSATFDVQYDNTLVPETSGRKEWVFKLVRMDSNSPWLIRDWGDATFK